MTTVIIGAGPAGLMCAGTIKKGNVIVLERNEKVGKKLYITGKGRCNVSNDCEDDKFLDNIVTNPKFMYGAIRRFSTSDAKTFFEKFGVPIKVERGNRMFPVSDKASDITNALKKYADKNCAIFRLNTVVKSIAKTDSKFKIFIDGGEYIECDNLVIATGGKSYPLTGSMGDGYRFAQMLGHNVIKPRSALVPLIVKQDVKPLEGLSLKNIEVKVKCGKKTYKQFGEMLFTSQGVSGPCVLSLSSYISRDNVLDATLSIDLKPALSCEQLDARILRDFDKYKNKQIKNSLHELLPKSMIPFIIEYVGFDGEQSVNSITKVQREKLISALKDLQFTVKSLGDLERGIVTGGGVDVKQISPKDMQSKIVESLYFAGEVLDVDALTGGFNIQIALSSGYVAGSNIGEE